jgi:Fic family protein
MKKPPFFFLELEDGTSLLLKACIFYYELEFIHPFEYGNGRMGRLWQQLILMKHSKILAYISVESLVHQKHKQYNKVQEKCDNLDDSTAFIEFSLELILNALKEFKENFYPQRQSLGDRVLVEKNI